MCLPAQEVQRLAFDPWVGKIPWRRTWQPTSVFLPGESMGRGAWRATVCGVTKSWTRLSRCACARTHTHTHTHTKRLQTQTTRLPTLQTGCPLPRFCSLCVHLQGFVNAVPRHLHTATVLPPSCPRLNPFLFLPDCYDYDFQWCVEHRW